VPKPSESRSQTQSGKFQHPTNTPTSVFQTVNQDLKLTLKFKINHLGRCRLFIRGPPPQEIKAGQEGRCAEGTEDDG